MESSECGSDAKLIHDKTHNPTLGTLICASHMQWRPCMLSVCQCMAGALEAVLPNCRLTVENVHSVHVIYLS